VDIIGLQGERARLVPPDRTLHLENALRWMNDPEVTASLKYNLGATRREEEAFFDRIESRNGTDYTWAIVDETSRHIGFVGLHGINGRHRSATGGILIGERDAWGKGYATDAVRVRSRFAFDRLNLHRIEGHTTNPAMRRVYEKCGYRHEGTLRAKFWRDGRWLDAEVYALLERDFEALLRGLAAGSDQLAKHHG
jgi:ribosomal-protein-alanine N-acetyltransferase